MRLLPVSLLTFSESSGPESTEPSECLSSPCSTICCQNSLFPLSACALGTRPSLLRLCVQPQASSPHGRCAHRQCQRFAFQHPRPPRNLSHFSLTADGTLQGRDALPPQAQPPPERCAPARQLIARVDVAHRFGYACNSGACGTPRCGITYHLPWAAPQPSTPPERSARLDGPICAA